MSARHFDDQDFVGSDEELVLERTNFSGCTFRSCSFVAASLRGAHLTDCRFENCDLSAADLTDALLHGVEFDTCRLGGVDFGVLRREATGVTAAFSSCDLSLATFKSLDLRTCSLRSSRITEAEFVGCDLREVPLSGNDFTETIFHDNDLRQADMRGSRNYIVSALNNQVRGLRVDLPEALGLLAALEVKVGG